MRVNTRKVCKAFEEGNISFPSTTRSQPKGAIWTNGAGVIGSYDVVIARKDPKNPKRLLVAQAGEWSKTTTGHCNSVAVYFAMGYEIQRVPGETLNA